MWREIRRDTEGDPDRCGERSEETQRVTQTDVERDQKRHRG